MERALKLARSVVGATSPNPSVGAVVVKDGTEVGWGTTSPPGHNHAEVNALKQAGALASGAVLYTTLEPCNISGRTPPCTRAIIDSGVAQVNVAAIDPNPLVSGNGCAELRSAGIDVQVGEQSEAAQALYEAFAKHIRTGIPFVSVKFAMSLDGKIAAASGDSKWVTGVEARSLVQQMRRESDAILVGVNTVLADDPQLTTRDRHGEPLPRQPLRVVVDTRCRTPASARMLKQPGNTVIATTLQSPDPRIEQLAGAGAELLALPACADGKVNLQVLLEELGRRGVVSLLVEGGGALLGSLFDNALVDKVFAFIAPVIIGGEAAVSPVEGSGAESMAKAWKLQRPELTQIGPDWLVTGYTQGKD